MTIRTTPSTYKPRGTKIAEIIDIIYFNGTDKIGFVVCVTDEGSIRHIKYSDLEPKEEVDREIERLKRVIQNEVV